MIDLWGFLSVALAAGVGAFCSSYLKEKGKNYASKEDYQIIKEQLEKNTSVVEQIRHEFGHKTWSSQQIWLIKQKCYESIFRALFDIRKYVESQRDEYLEWRDIYFGHPYLDNINYSSKPHVEAWEKQKKEHEIKKESDEYKRKASELEKSYKNALEDMHKAVLTNEIFLDEKVGKVIDEMVIELQSTHDYEEWDVHFDRICAELDKAINNLKVIGKSELAG